MIMPGFMAGRIVTPEEARAGRLEPCEHDWELGLIGTGTETCKRCGLGRQRAPRENPEEEKRLQYAEEGFRNAANYIAEELQQEAETALATAGHYDRSAATLRKAAEAAKLIGKGRDGK